MISKCILILGMHRSGTSALTGSLRLMDIYIGKNKDLIQSRHFNKKGHFELGRILNINKLLLKKLNSNWYDVRNLVIDENKMMVEYNLLKEFISNYFKDYDKFAIKDPRLCLLLPLYVRLLRELKIEIKPIVIKRNKDAICKSLQKRNRFTYEHASKLTEKYWNSINKFLETSGLESLEITFEGLLNNTDDVLLEISKYLDVELDDGIRSKVFNFLDKRLKHF